MFKIKQSLRLACAALMLAVLSPMAAADVGMTPTSPNGMAPIGQFVSLRVNGTHVAYGLILSPTKILVPAHAVGGAVSSYTILAGSTDVTTVSCTTCQLRAATAAIRHPSYNSSNYSNDVAIVRIAALTTNSTVFAGSIAGSFSNGVGSQFTQIGYRTGGTNYNRLQTTVTTPWTLSTMAGYVFTPGDFVTATVSPNPTAPIVINGMINYYNSAAKTQVYTKLSDYAAWISAN
jgi:hypothetical protein